MDGLHFFMVRSAASKRLVNGAAPRRPPKDAPMRISALAIATILATAPARAQTYNPDYPVCLQVYGIGGGYIACGYTSLAQCSIGIGPRGAVHHQSVFCERARACGTASSAASPQLLNESAQRVAQEFLPLQF
jgi:hypothetical protein